MQAFLDDVSRWDAVVSRNATADGAFVYAVKTTKIFCRPICKARLARRANVRFFTSGADAQEAGFRACKRCKPEVAGGMPEEAAVRKIRGFVAAQRGPGERLSLSQMARQTGLSKWHFHRVFKKCVGMTPSEYLKNEREINGIGGESAWLDSLDLGGIEPDFDFSWLEQSGNSFSWSDSAQPSSTETLSSGTTASTPWSIDDFVSWPDDGTAQPA